MALGFLEEKNVLTYGNTSRFLLIKPGFGVTLEIFVSSRFESSKAT